MNRDRIFWLLGIPSLLVLTWWLLSPLTAPGLAVQLLALVWTTIALVRLARLAMRVLLWRVSRRLAFSYILIGVVPIPLVAALIGLGTYIAAGFFLGHRYADALDSMQHDMEITAQMELDRLLGQAQERPSMPVPVRLAYYRDGQRFAGESSMPRTFMELWPRTDNRQTFDGVPLFADAEGRPTLFAAAVSGRYAVAGYLDGDLEEELRRITGLWIELSRAEREERVVFHVNGRAFPLEALRPEAPWHEIQKFFWHKPDEMPTWRDKPWLTWLELSRPFLEPDNGEEAESYISATLVATPTSVLQQIQPSAPEVNFFVYLVFASVFLATLNLYIVALLVALMMIYGLSRAVNRLTEATNRLQKGDFSSRIEVMRRDQIGALQRSFNSMAGNLETLVAQAAEKEIFERELEIAGQMQQSLLPDHLDTPEPLELASYFRPSRAIGGDYYDLLPLPDGRLAVAVADVAGHGLPAGMRMAMVKSAFELLCEESSSPREVLRRLHHLLRHRLGRKTGGDDLGQRRAFVTATLAAINLETRSIEIVGAGHPPTYLLRSGVVTAIELPGTPLGILEPTLPSSHHQLQDGDVLVWISDGLIEATDKHDEAFGYDRIEATLSGLEGRPERVKGALLEAVAEHYGDGGRLDDDLTLVVLGWGTATREATN